MEDVDVRELMERVRREATRLRQAMPDLEVPDLAPGEPLQLRPELEHLNRRWVIEMEPVPARPGTLHGARSAAKRFVTRLVRATLSSYLLEEREFFANLVRLLNESARRQDRLEDDLRAVARSLRELADTVRERTERLREHDRDLHRLLEARVERLEAASRNQRSAPRSGE